QPDDDWRPGASGYDRIGSVSGNDAEGENSCQLGNGFAHRLLERWTVSIAGFQEVLFDQVSNDFGVSLGGELVSLLSKLLFERQVVFDDAVVDDDDASGAVAVGVSIFFGGTATRCKEGVADAIGSVEWPQPDGLFEVAQLALGAANLQAFSVTADGNAGGIVAAVLQPPQAINDYRHNRFLSNVADNTAHGRSPDSAGVPMGLKLTSS